MAKAPQAAKDPYTSGSGGWPIPQWDNSLTFRDIGSSGLRQFGGWVREEYLPELQGRQAARVYREMSDGSSTIGALIFSIIGAMRKCEWKTKAASDKPEAIEAAEFADSLRFDMSHTWEDHLAEACSMVIYGFSPHEIVYKRRLGPTPRGNLPGSAYNDGKIGIRRLPIRGQDTVLKWFFGVNGEILGLTQQPWVGPLIDIPIEKLLLYRPRQHKNNPEGNSILRNSYRPWFFTKRLEEQEAIMFERLSGFPVMRVPSLLMEEAANPTNPNNASAVQAMAVYSKAVKNIRIDEQMGLVIPSDPFRDGDGKMSSVRMFDFDLITPQSGRANIDADKSISRYRIDMYSTVLADWIMMGHEVRGTNNLATTKVDMYHAAIEGWMRSIATVQNRFLLPRVWALNGMDRDLMPAYEPEMPQRIDLDGLGAFVANLASAGMMMFPDDDLENFLRDAAGMPEIAQDDEDSMTAGVSDVIKAGNADALKRRLLANAARKVLSQRRMQSGGRVRKAAIPFVKQRAKERWATY